MTPEQLKKHNAWFLEQKARRDKEIADEVAAEKARRAEVKEAQERPERIAKERRLAKAEERRIADQPAKKLALIDGGRLSKRFSTVFGVRLGSVLSLPECYKTNIDINDPIKAVFTIMTPKTSEETCWDRDEDGSTGIVWASSSRPGWAEKIAADVRDDVLVGVTITFSNSTRPGTLLAAVETIETIAQRNLADSHKQLYQKYGKPTREHVASYTNGQKIFEPEWDLPGLRVQYKSEPYDDTITIQLESAAKESARKAREEEDAVPQL